MSDGHERKNVELRMKAPLGEDGQIGEPELTIAVDREEFKGANAVTDAVAKINKDIKPPVSTPDSGKTDGAGPGASPADLAFANANPAVAGAVEGAVGRELAKIESAKGTNNNPAADSGKTDGTGTDTPSAAAAGSNQGGGRTRAKRRRPKRTGTKKKKRTKRQKKKGRKTKKH
jgi:hypothetical protein